MNELTEFLKDYIWSTSINILSLPKTKHVSQLIVQGCLDSTLFLQRDEYQSFDIVQELHGEAMYEYLYIGNGFNGVAFFVVNVDIFYLSVDEQIPMFWRKAKNIDELIYFIEGVIETDIEWEREIVGNSEELINSQMHKYSTVSTEVIDTIMKELV